jgi:hypothetical protein
MLMNQPGTLRPSTLTAMRRFSAFALFAALFAGTSTLALHAQQAMDDTKLVSSLKTQPTDLAATSGLSYSSSNSDPVTPATTVEEERLNLATGVGDSMQPPPRRRYGRPRYNDNQHNADGSQKWTFELGVGGTGPVGNTFHHLNTSYGFQVGGGRNFNKNFGVLAQFDYDRFGFNGRTLYNQQALYNYSCTPAAQAAGTCAPINNLDGNSHVWSFSIDPIYTVYDGPPIGAYIVAGAGFYHKVANFTLPQNACADEFCEFTVTENVNVDHYTSNAPGFNGGIGITFKAGKFSSEHLFAEARYVLLLNSQRDGLTASNINTTAGQAYYNSGATDYYPANSNRTTYTAYKAGIRF